MKRGFYQSLSVGGELSALHIQIISEKNPGGLWWMTSPHFRFQVHRMFIFLKKERKETKLKPVHRIITVDCLLCCVSELNSI